MASKFRPASTEVAPWTEKPEEVEKPTVLGDGYRPDHAEDNLGYEREVPEHFSEGSDDQLMNSMIKNWAIEGKGEDGLKTGKYYMDRFATTEVAKEVVGTHMGFTGEKLTSYVDKHMDALWPLYDVNKDGYIEADRAPVVLRRVIGDVEIANGLQ